jgi:segregation and condensation protein A
MTESNNPSIEALPEDGLKTQSGEAAVPVVTENSDVVDDGMAVAVKSNDSPKSGSQQEMPFALVLGEPVTQLPLDLYIPPDALEVILEQFEGPLDLLLYLIRKQNLDILEINVFEITQQYMQYVEMMQSEHLELAGEYLVMAAMLAEIKSRILLPRPDKEDDEEEDPRAELIRRLQDYERFKQAAEDLDEYPRMGRDTFEIEIKSPEYTAEKQHPDVNFKELMVAFSDVLHRSNMFTEHEVHREKLSTRERMSQILANLQGNHDQFTPFTQLFTVEEGRNGVVTTFLATLELIKEQLIEIVQNELFGPIHVKAKVNSNAREQ